MREYGPVRQCPVLFEHNSDLVHSHFDSGAFQHIRFHGKSRPREPGALQKQNIVLTTYATLAADHCGHGLMYHMDWYRVVLDEGRFVVRIVFLSFLLSTNLSNSPLDPELVIKTIQSSIWAHQQKKVVSYRNSHSKLTGRPGLTSSISAHISHLFQRIIPEVHLRASRGHKL